MWRGRLNGSLSRDYWQAGNDVRIVLRLVVTTYSIGGWRAASDQL